MAKNVSGYSVSGNSNNNVLGDAIGALRYLLGNNPNWNSEQNAQAKDLDKTGKLLQERNAYQKGVEKALKVAGEQHAMAALEQGVPSEHIIDQAGLNPSFDSQKQLMSQLVDIAKTQSDYINSQPQILAPKGAFSKQGFDANGNLQLGGIFDFSGTPLNNLIMAQQLTGRGRMQASDIAKSDLEIAQAKRRAEEVPLTQQEQAQSIAGFNTAQIQAYNDAATRLTSQIDALNKQFAEEQKTITPMMWAGAAATGKPALTPNMVKIQSAVARLQNKLNELNSRGPAGLVNPSREVKTSPKKSGFKVISVRE